MSGDVLVDGEDARIISHIVKNTHKHKMKTWISDVFPLEKLECQYFDICKHYDPNRCSFTSPCEVRHDLKGDLENYVGANNLKIQVQLLIEEDGKKKRII